jgi:hypothetical protein
MKGVCVVICYLLSLSMICLWAAGDQGSNVDGNFSRNGEILLKGPSEILPNEVVAVQGSGVEPNDTVMLSLQVIWNMPLPRQMNVINASKIAAENLDCNQTALIPIWGARHCAQSRDYMSAEISPVCSAIVGWKHSAAFEEECGRTDVHYKNPYYVWFNGTNCKASYSRIFHSEEHCECWTIAFAARLCNGSAFKVMNTAKRLVRADKKGEFSTSIRVPITKLMGGDHVLLANSSNESGKLIEPVNVSSIKNEPPIAFIYAQEMFNRLWSAGVNEPIFLDGQSLSIDNDGYIVSYQWDFGDGEISNEPMVRHSFGTPGEKKIVLTVKDNEGTLDSMDVYIEVV